MTRALVSLVVPCFNNGKEAVAAVEAMGQLALPERFELEAIVADDASTDDSRTVLETSLPGWARVVKSTYNRGRSGAINLGVECARGEYLFVLDADCIPLDREFLRSHLAMLSDNADASVGDVEGQATGFWGRYQSAAGRRRARAASAGSIHGLTTANLMIRAAAFRAIGGFDARYSHYGFEDRDFLLRLQRAGFRVQHSAHAVVRHVANADLTGICRKMRESGSRSSLLFRTAHPRAYRELGYAAIDATLHPVRAALLAPLARLALPRTARIEGWLQRERWPYHFRAAVVRAVTALAYFDGTRSTRAVASGK